MCGIAGFIDFKKEDVQRERCLPETIKTMLKTLTHRGPDDHGTWVDAQAGIALGHRRLSIVDLSQEGHQPMQSACGRYVIVFNGEIYNFQDIRRELEASGASPAWRGHSDTEVMLAAVSHWGLEPAVKRFAGMFAFALWDRQERVLHLVRDRAGEKPLYYGILGGVFAFASELKALRSHPAWHSEIDRDALCLFLRLNYIPVPYTIYKGIFKLTPGHILSLSGGVAPEGLSSPRTYWDAREVVKRCEAEGYAGSDQDAIDELEQLIGNSVARQMIADVPLGAFLSGGVDSSTIVALMQTQSSRPVKTFTIGFKEAGYNEAEYAKEVARHLGTDHTELYVSPAEAMNVIPKMPYLYDEPFSDSSQIPTYLISELTRRYVTVSLSGDAGDEVFGGYNRYLWAGPLWNKIGWMPAACRGTAASILQSIPPQLWNNLSRSAAGPFKRKSIGLLGDKIFKLSEIIAVKDPAEIYRQLISHWKNPSSVVINGTEPDHAVSHSKGWPVKEDFTRQMMFCDFVTYLADDILVKVDRAAMGVGLETRVPFLDHRVVEFAWRLPLSIKIRNGQGKWVLRQVLYKYVPKALIERPKAGFSIPLDSWLRGPLRDWAEALLDENRLRSEGFFNPGPIRKKWDEHQSCRRNWQYHLWDILMFQAWLEAWKS